jgi:ABC-2 type transport system ATP-binding protein
MIQFRNVTKSIRKGLLGRRVSLLAELSFSIQAGECVALIGHNGAGKTTTMKLMTALSRPSSGTVFLAGRPVTDADARKILGFAPETPRFPGGFSARELVRLHGRLAGAAVDPSALLAMVDLAGLEESRVETWSKGQRQRLSLAVALVGDPQVLVLDEPMSGLDPAGRALVRDLIAKLRVEGRTIVFSSHVLPDVASLADRALVLKSGKLVLDRPLQRRHGGWMIRFARAHEGRRTVDVPDGLDPWAEAAALERSGAVIDAVDRTDDFERDIVALLTPDGRTW